MKNNINFLRNAFSKTGTYFKQTTLEDVLMHCYKDLPRDGEKSKYGSVFVYDSTQLGIHLDNEKSTGIILIDIDNIEEEMAKEIYDNFELLKDVFPSLLAIQFSSSYYINANKNGLHIYIKSEKLDKTEYKIQSSICLGIFAQLCEQYLNINLLQYQKKTNKQVLDFHNTNLYQRFNLFYSEFRYNENAKAFSVDIISSDDLEKLTAKYGLELEDEVVHKTITPIPNNITQGGNISKICIDRYFKIGKYKGNDIRFRISIIADKIFGENAKSFCDKYFYYENGKSIYTRYSSANTINPLIYKWLVKNGYIVESHQALIENWISEFANEITDEISKNNLLEIIAPTGTGKTTFINENLAHHFNSVVIVPFNVTNKLYNKLFEVNAAYIGEIPDNKPLVMVWDQAIKHWDKIKDRHLIIDEADRLFFDRTYRDSAIKLILKIKENNSHTTFITATPAGESELFNMKLIRYFKKRDYVSLDIKTTKNTDWAEYNYIKNCIDNNYYDRVVLLDDMNARKIYEKLVSEGYANEISYIRSSTKDTEDFINLRETELLTKRITICTCIAFTGLNFKNTKERILVVGSINLGQTTSNEIVQQVGRIRQSHVKGVYFYDPQKRVSIDVEDVETRAKEMNNLVVNGVSDTFLQYDRRYLNEDYVSAQRQIQNYIARHSEIDTIVMELNEHGYFKGIVGEELPDERFFVWSCR